MLTKKQVAWKWTLQAAIAAFGVYTCMYAFRKPFTSAGFEGLSFLGVHYKIWLVMAQTAGYTASKFFGIGFIGALKHKNRATTIVRLISIAWLALLFFAIIPAPYNIIFLLINGFPLGVIYGIVFSYLEGRRTTEVLGAVLATSFIFASGFTQSAGKAVMLYTNASEWWMPWITGLIFFVPMVFFAWLLEKIPPPAREDIIERSERIPMNKSDRKKFIRTFFPGLILLITAYIMLTIIRDYRSNFSSNIWNELGYAANAAVYTQSELPASIIVLVLMGLLVLIRKNFLAFIINHVVIIAGFIIAIGATLLFMNEQLSPFWWMTLTGVGLYMGYVPFNCMLFDRMIAGFRYPGNAGFIIYLADSFGYLGSDAVLIMKNFLQPDISWTAFLVKLVLVVSVLGIVLVCLSGIYFKNKYLGYSPLNKTSLNYG